MLRLVWQANPRDMLLTMLLTIVGALATPTQIWLVKVLIDRVGALAQVTLTQGVPAESIEWTFLAAPLVALFGVLIMGDA